MAFERMRNRRFRFSVLTIFGNGILRPRQYRGGEAPGHSQEPINWQNSSDHLHALESSLVSLFICLCPLLPSWVQQNTSCALSVELLRAPRSLSDPRNGATTSTIQQQLPHFHSAGFSFMCPALRRASTSSDTRAQVAKAMGLLSLVKGRSTLDQRDAGVRVTFRPFAKTTEPILNEHDSAPGKTNL